MPSPQVLAVHEYGGELGQRVLTFVQDAYATIKLDPKTRELVWLGIAAATGARVSFPMHLQGALREGATRDEIVSVILMTTLSSGLNGAYEAMLLAAEEFKRLDAQSKR
jgi:AhpD family alkylhydroperoxidase